MLLQMRSKNLIYDGWIGQVQSSEASAGWKARSGNNVSSSSPGNKLFLINNTVPLSPLLTQEAQRSFGYKYSRTAGCRLLNPFCLSLVQYTQEII